MSEVTWNLGFLQQHDSFNVLLASFGNAVILGGTTSSFTVKDGSDITIFEGSFTLTNGVIAAGTISGFDTYYDNPGNHLIDAVGYAIDVGDFKQALTDWQAKDSSPLFELLFGNSMIVNGSVRGDLVPGGFLADHLHGGNGGDRLFGDSGNDFLFGDDGNDSIFGGPGNDLVYGGLGSDQVDAGDGDDFISGGDDGDTIDGGPGSDAADYSEKTEVLTIALKGPNPSAVALGGFVEDTISNIENVNGGAANDRITGDGFANLLIGNDGDDRLSGKVGNDQLFGQSGDDRLKGGKDNDTVDGGEGHDILKGGSGKDTFFFDVNAKPGNADKILDFAGKDGIALDADVFATVNDSGKLKARFFALGEAKDDDDHIVYDNGKLFYDADGKGGFKQIEFDKLKGDPHIAADDFMMV